MGVLQEFNGPGQILHADFDAFKFPTSSVVQFRALVNYSTFCLIEKIGLNGNYGCQKNYFTLFQIVIQLYKKGENRLLSYQLHLKLEYFISFIMKG